MFPTIKGTKLEIRNYEKALRDAGRQVNITIHPHQLRNNFAKYYILNGGIYTTQKPLYFKGWEKSLI